MPLLSLSFYANKLSKTLIKYTLFATLGTTGLVPTRSLVIVRLRSLGPFHQLRKQGPTAFATLDTTRSPFWKPLSPSADHLEFSKSQLEKLPFGRRSGVLKGGTRCSTRFMEKVSSLYKCMSKEHWFNAMHIQSASNHSLSLNDLVSKRFNSTIENT